MIQMVRLDPEQRLRMGQAGRTKVLREFDENIVIHRYLKAIRQVEEANVLPVPASAQARRVAEPNTMPE
jgi:hypothetical protein